MITLGTKVEAVLGDQPRKRKAIVEGLGIETVEDLLHHFPRRYLETGRLSDLGSLREGQLLTIVGEVAAAETKSYTDRRTGKPAYRVEVLLRADGAGRLKMTFFAKSQWIVKSWGEKLHPGRRGVFQGKASQFGQQWQLTNPSMVLFGPGGGDESGALLSMENMPKFFPIYPLTKGVETWDLQRACAFALSVLDEVPEPLDEDLRQRYGVVGRRQAIEWIHAPDEFAQVSAARRRFRFEEALTLQLVLGRRRRELMAQGAQARTGGVSRILEAFDARLPFELTKGQRAVGEEIEAELAQPHPMHRLLQGEVGSGKTLVALRAMLRTVDSGGQAVLLAPTEVLAQQHYRSISAMLGDLAGGGMLGGADESTGVALLTGSMTRAQRQQALLDIVTGDAGIVIGTHALLEKSVEFHDLGLVVVDEQHRFGVEQRAALTDKAGSPPHVLVMTATPIPRTVAMTVFGDLEVSTLSELPAGRAPIQTNVVPLADAPHWLGRVWERVREEVAKGHQAYVVCPRISGDVVESGQQDVVHYDEDGNPVAPPRPLAAVEEVAAELRAGALSGLRVGVLHGRLQPEEKDRTMRAFAAGEIDVLVSTTVIEVGVDVANATAMVLLDADRFGVSQLHQLRGRVGRGGLPGLCLLVSWAEFGTDARERLDAVASTTDGFTLSQVDLEQRREGDVLGKRQSGGRSSLVTLKVLRDEDVILEARRAADELLDEDLALGQVPLLRDAVVETERSVESEFLERG
ncbi:ATP-dependent DNA helicase RecG [Nocardioides jiangxiensis]|uniref:ATP-dependent DNA helicase RecG n=1 Tax=Nocardioides jiangxiensis TaxID=3064524 RepID=A0ABT9B2U5_9ACTN|nr:ATP-dependent DNA helicase RecG [Nocardioides sp. WY-20]MDO7869164.1 ATP-dependent DNA helicase RecG [Nocardioides sp. WY-20]